VSQDSSSYLRDHGIHDGLEQLISQIESIDGVKSARILYLYPSTTTHKLIDAIASSGVFHNYFDMPLQHISARVLKTMKRGKKVEQLKTLMQYMKQQPNAFVRTTFIVGHPGETQEDFKQLCDYVRTFGFDRANVFAYSNEEGTLAFEMNEQIDETLIEERLDILGEIIEQTTQQSLQNEIGKIVDVIIDKQSEEHEYLLSARKLIWAPDIDGEIYINDNELEQTLEFGVIYKAKITELAGDKLLATVVQKA
jgi:tRNA A37 methylthiotransferase MiaB